MAKVRLDINALRVESFETVIGLQARGTVRGREGELNAGEAGSLQTYPYECTPRSICHNSCVDGRTDACDAPRAGAV